jgi:hypothetical protein
MGSVERLVGALGPDGIAADADATGTTDFPAFFPLCFLPLL